jgi:hypothetical protein
MKFGTVDGLRVRGGQSAVHEDCSPELFSAVESRSRRSAYRWWFANELVADGPPGYCGQSATGQKDGVGLIWLIFGCPFLTPTKPSTTLQRLPLFLSQARGGDFKVKTFWRDSRTVRAHPQTLIKILHHVLSATPEGSQSNHI